MTGPRSIVVLGMMTKMPVPGVVWQTVHYLVGLERLGYDVYYVEAHARTPSMFMETEEDDGSGKAAAFIDGIMRRFGFADRWAFQALHDDRRCYGMSAAELRRRYEEAELLINLHGGTEPLPEHSRTGRLVYVETDPVLPQVELYWGLQATIDFLEPHIAFFTFGENYGAPDCRLPVTDRFDFKPTRQPVVLDFWRPSETPHERFTTISNWRQDWRELTLDGETYSWSKHLEFMKFVDLPARTGQSFELALSGYTAADERFLGGKGWQVGDAFETCGDIDAYHEYIRHSHAEFTVAKDQNVRLRTGWFSDRSATYLAASKPVVTQDTGFGNVLPTGDGLFAFSNLVEAVEAVERINADYERQTEAAREIAREYFDAEVVLGQMLAEVGVERPRRRSIPAETSLTPSSRRPLELPEATVAAALSLEPVHARPDASLVVVTYGDSVPTRLCLDSILRHTDSPTYELIVVDNGSDGAGRVYLRALERRNSHVQVLFNDENAGFARALNQGLARVRGNVLVLMNNDVIVPPHWLGRLTRHLHNFSVGLVGPVTNRSGNEAEVRTTYETYGEFLEVARARAAEQRGESTEIPTLTMFCLAMRRDAYERIGPLDEQFGRGLLEDDDYSRRARETGFRLVCAEDVLVHHFGEASFGALVPTGEYNELLAENKRRFEEKWAEPWQPYDRRPDPEYERVKEGVRELVREHVPPDAAVLVASRGDDELLELDGRPASHFLQAPEGFYAGRHPDDSAEAIAELERLRSGGAAFLAFPRTAFWWLEHYDGLREHLDAGGGVVARSDDCAIYALEPAAGEERTLEGDLRRPLREAHDQLLVREEELERLVHSEQKQIATASGDEGGAGSDPASEPNYFAYRELVRGVRETVDRLVPSGASVLVVSKGDEALLELGGRRAFHFPEVGGVYLGRNPVDSAEAVAQLEALRESGDFLVLPESERWWLEHYEDFAQHLRGTSLEIAVPDGGCAIFDLRAGSGPAGGAGAGLIRMVSPNDLMYRHDTRFYLSWGDTAMRAVRCALAAADAGEPARILDLPSGHGRVLRFLRAAFPAAEIVACDVDLDGVEFCARTFGATPVEAAPDPADVRLPGGFDLIWCGSLLTHMPGARWDGFLTLFESALAPGGLLIFTTHGNHIARLLQSGEIKFGISSFPDYMAEFERQGFVHQPSPPVPGVPLPPEYGIALSKPAWVCDRIAPFERLRLLMYMERGWGGLQDVVACVREDS